MRKIRLIFIAIAVISVGLVSFYQIWLRPRYVVPILMYHHIGEGEGSLWVSVKNFDRQMAYLRDHHYAVISLEELADGIESGKTFPHKTAVITFDDGAKDNYTLAFPIFKKYGFPVTIFILTQETGIYEDTSFLSWPQVREMAAAGVSFGSHTRTHANLPDLNEAQLQDEIMGSKKDLEGHLGPAVRFLCYPVGRFTEKAKAVTRKAGYRGALTTNRGVSRFNTDLFELKRVKVKNDDLNKPFTFFCKLSGYYNLLRSTKKGH